MEISKDYKSGTFIKFLFILKKFWYIVFISVICTGLLGFFIGQKKVKETNLVNKNSSYVILKADVIITDGKFQEFNQTFNNTCLYFMKTNSLIKRAVSIVNENVTEAEAEKIINIKNLDSNLSNIIRIDIKYSSKEKTKQLLDTYLNNVGEYLNKTLKNNMKEDGSFKEGIQPENQIILKQVGDISYEEFSDVSKETTISVLKYTVVGSVLGLVIVICILYFLKFHFIIHSPIDVVKNFDLEFLGKFEEKKNLIEYINKNKTCYFCKSKDEKIIENFKCYTIEEIINNGFIDDTKTELVIIIREDIDSYHFIEKVQLLFRNKIRGFIIYK